MSRIGQAPVSVTADELEAQLDEQPELLEALCNGSIDAFVDAGPCPRESTTVIDLSGSQPVLIRQGRGSVEGLF